MSMYVVDKGDSAYHIQFLFKIYHQPFIFKGLENNEFRMKGKFYAVQIVLFCHWF